jgi:murein DD-endopeptidase MepM/ murein hydrolase activator NlpD
MRSKTWTVLAVGASALVLASAAAAQTPYRVKPGDTLTGLAATNDTTVSELRRLNPDLPADGRLRAGDTVNLPGRGVGSAAGRTHTVRSGETLIGIAVRYDTTLAELRRLNPDLPASGLVRVGEELVVAAPSASQGAADARGRTHTVRRGETLSGIAERYETTVAALKRLNPDVPENGRVDAGDRLVVAAAPDRSEAAARATASERRAGRTHTVRSGETLTGIAERYGTTVAALKSLNPDIPSSGRVNAGARIVISEAEARPPARAATAAAPSRRVTAGAATHTVEAGDTLFGIARSYGTTVAALRELNPEVPESGNVRIGQRLRLPRAPEAPTAVASPSGPGPVGVEGAAAAFAYVVQEGDTLSGVSRRFGVTLGELQAVSGLAPDAPLKDGQTLGLPPGAVDQGPQIYAMGASPPGVTKAAPPVRAEASVPTTSAPRATTAPTDEAPSPPARTDRTPTPDRPAAEPAPARPTPPAASPPAAPPAASPPARTPPPPARMPPAPVPSTAVDPDAAAAAGQGLFQWPVRGEVIGRFGPQGGGLRNDGVDIAATAGDPVRAAAVGEVVYAGDSVPGFGNLVLIKHDGGWVTAYAHLGRITVRMRERVVQGAQVGTVGASGGVSSPRLHFEVRYAPTPQDRARPIDPLSVLPPR